MDEKDTNAGPGEADPQSQSGQPRSVNLAAVAGGILIIGLIAFALYRRGTTVSPEAASQDQAPLAAPAGTMIAKEVPVALTPEASVIAERYRCVCGCQMALNTCTCSQSPGSNEMKLFLLKQVIGKNTSAAIDKAMIEKWGDQVLVNAAPPVTTKRPARPSKIRPDLR